MTGVTITVAAILIEVNCDKDTATIAFASKPDTKIQISTSEIEKFNREESANAASRDDCGAA